MDFKITPVAVDGFADADGVYENRHGAWLGECDGEAVQPYADEDGYFFLTDRLKRMSQSSFSAMSGLAPLPPRLPSEITWTAACLAERRR